MELIVLGSGTAAPSSKRAPPGFLLRAGADLVLLDAGAGTLGRLLQAGVGPDEVSHFFCTHNHLDHCGELASWLFASRVPACARRAPLLIGGSADFHRMLGAVRALYGRWLDAADYTLTLVTLSPHDAKVDGEGAAGPALQLTGWSVQAFAVNHTESSLAFRITDAAGRVFAYTGDTGVCATLVDLARDADLLLIESSSPDGMKIDGHLTPSEAGAVARQAGARRVLLTHLYPVCDGVDMLGQLRRTYDGEAMVAEDGLRLTV